MKKTKIFLLLLIFCTLPAVFGDENSEPEPLPPELREVLAKVDDANKGLQTLEADVCYTRAIPLLGDSENSKGRLIFESPDKMHINLGEPRNEEMISDGRYWWLVDHRARQVEIYAADDDYRVAEASFLKIGYGADTAALRKDYVITLLSVEETEPENKQDAEEKIRWHIAFEPRNDEKPSQFERMEVKVTDRFYLPETIILHESDGEIVHTFRLEKIRLNKELDDELFEYDIPRGYTVIDG